VIEAPAQIAVTGINGTGIFAGGADAGQIQIACIVDDVFFRLCQEVSVN
jgi:hypothetical protein